jgi:hypothetical protein
MSSSKNKLYHSPTVRYVNRCVKNKLIIRLSFEEIMWYLQKIINTTVLSILCIIVFQHQILAQRDAFKKEDGDRMKKEAEALVLQYFEGLKEVGNPRNIYKQEDIDQMITNQFESASTPIYDDLSRGNANQASFNARVYLGRVAAWYKYGVTFNFNYRIDLLCPNSQENYYYVKVACKKTLRGELTIENEALNINEDSLDIYVKFQIEQNRPVLKYHLY